MKLRVLLAAASVAALGSTTAAAQPARALELGLELSAVHRPSETERVQYLTGPRWSASATVVMAKWLGLHLAGGMEYHQVRIEPGALGPSGAVTDQPNMLGPHVVVQAQPMWPLGERFELFGRAGLGWQRFSASPIRLGRPTPLIVSERAGVLIELPVAVGLRCALWRDRVAIAALAGMDIVLSHSGALFDAGTGASQSVRQDTGTVVYADAFPAPRAAFNAGIGLQYFF